MINKKDPMAGDVRALMERSAKIRQAEQRVNESFGVMARAGLPHEKRAEYDARLRAEINKINSGTGTLTEGTEVKKKIDESVSLRSIQEEIYNKLVEKYNVSSDKDAFIRSLSEEQLSIIDLFEQMTNQPTDFERAGSWIYNKLSSSRYKPIPSTTLKSIPRTSVQAPPNQSNYDDGGATNSATPPKQPTDFQIFGSKIYDKLSTSRYKSNDVKSTAKPVSVSNPADTPPDDMKTTSKPPVAASVPPPAARPPASVSNPADAPPDNMKTTTAATPAPPPAAPAPPTNSGGGSSAQSSAASSVQRPPQERRPQRQSSSDSGFSGPQGRAGFGDRGSDFGG